MKEELMYFIWRSGQLFQKNLKTKDGKKITVLKPGIRNLFEGPDFLNARLKIKDIVWNGQVEFHLKSSDWNLHGHQFDPRYNNVILHVVMEDDKKVFTKNGVSLPTLELYHYTDEVQLQKYFLLEKGKGWIPCDPLIHHYKDDFLWSVYLSRLAVERLRDKTLSILSYLDSKNGDWEQTTLYFFLRYFIGKNNAAAISELMNKTPMKVLKKYSSDKLNLEALLLGQAGLLSSSHYIDAYAKELKKRYGYLSMLHQLTPISSNYWNLFGIWPSSTPTIRLSQFCDLMVRYPRLMGLFISTKSVKELKRELKSSASTYWDNHYQLDIPANKSFRKTSGKDVLDRLILNTAAPIVFAYGQYTGNTELKERALDWWEELSPENNQIIRKWAERGISAGTALESQGLLHLKNNYCDKSKCLNCSFGNKVLHKNKMDEKVCEEFLFYTA